MVGLVCGIGDRRKHIIALESGVVGGDLLDRGLVGQQLEDVGDADTLAANAWPAASIRNIQTLQKAMVARL